MQLVLIVNPDLGWDSVISVFDGETITEEQWERMEEICEDNSYILIDWKRLDGVESFLRDYQD